MKFVICSARQFWGGTIVAHYLCKLLEEKGYSASIYLNLPNHENRLVFALSYLHIAYRDIRNNIYTRLFPNSEYARRHYTGYIHFPVKGCKRKYWPVVDDDTVVVYTETVKGNPLHAKNVVRWFLYYNRYPDDPNWCSTDDLFFSYREQFNDPALNPEGRLLKIFHFDSDLYKQTNFGHRKGACYVIRKGIDRSDLPEKFDGPVIDNLREPEKVKILNQCEKCYLYDTQTFYASIAALCGCIPIVVPEPGKTKNDYVKKDDYIPGVAYGDTPKEIEYAVHTRSAVAQGVSDQLYENDKNVSSFVEICKRYFHLT